MPTTTPLSQSDVETRVRSWTTVDAAGAAVIPTAIEFHARLNKSATPVTWTTDGAGGTINGVVDDADGTGTWTVAAGDLAAGEYDWWALATVGAEVIIPSALSGRLTITDR